MLFDQIKRSQRNSDERVVSIFQYLNQYGSSALLNAVESWFVHYPEEHRHDLRSRFRSDNNDNHDGALFELACHEILRHEGFVPEIHPELPGSSKRPDFLIRESDKKCYFEVTVTGTRDGPFELHPNEQGVIDHLNSLTSQDFYIGVEFKGKLTTTLSRRKIVDPFEDLLQNHTRDEVVNITKGRRRDDAPFATISHGDWLAKGWLVPIADPEIGTRRSQIVRYPFKAARTDVAGSVKTAINHKRKRYGELDAPLVIAVNVRDIFYNGFDNDMGILFGQEVISYSSSDPDIPGVTTRRDNGIWSRQRKVDAVFICSCFDILNLRNLTARLYVNPRTDSSNLPSSLLRIPRAEWTDEQIKWYEGDNITHLLGIDEHELVSLPDSPPRV